MSTLLKAGKDKCFLGPLADNEENEETGKAVECDTKYYLVLS